MINLDKVLLQIESKGYKVNEITKFSGGANSESYEILSNKKKYFLKIYINNKINKINRCQREKKFLDFLNNIEILNVPKSIINDSNMNWILLSWIEGKKVSAVNHKICNQFIDFLILIQSFRDKSVAKKLPLAADAFFTIKDHINAIEKRHIYLLSLKKKDLKKLDESTSSKLKNLIFKNLKDITNLKDLYSIKNTLGFDNEIPQDKRIISQSDVGFHNMICNGNKTFFVDFEYAGWDDPFKLFSDILLQPDHNLPLKFINLLDNFVENYIYINKSQTFRLLLMLKLYRLKWSVIILNPIFKSQDLDILEFNKFVNNKIKKSLNYLKESSERIKKIKERYC